MPSRLREIAAVDPTWREIRHPTIRVELSRPLFERLLEVCIRRQRTSSFLGARAIEEWLDRQAAVSVDAADG